jgi:imidazoleglycerol-phosphate dehydratase
MSSPSQPGQSAPLAAAPGAPRTASLRRDTKETQIAVSLVLDGSGGRELDTPIAFFTHMLDAFGRHGLFDLGVSARGDIEVDGHHTVEDTGLLLGDAFRAALGDKRGITRFGEATIPMDETLVQAVVDFSGRPYFVWDVAGLDGKWVGGFDCELAREFFAAFATRAECNLHLRLLYGKNAHHIIEALFKATARAVRVAVGIDPRLSGQVPSTKGTLTA